MTLTINQTPVDSSLDGERTLGEVLASVQKWAQSQNQTVMSILVDGRAVLAADLAMDIRTVSQLDVEVVGAAGEFEAKLQVVEDYFELVSRALATGDAAVLRELHAEYGAVTTALDQVLTYQAPLSDAQLATLSGPWTPLSGLAPVISALRERLTEVRRETQSPQDAFSEAVRHLQDQLPQWAELSLFWQRGQDQLALEGVQDLMGTLGRLQRTSTSDRLPSEARALWARFRAEAEPFLLEIEASLAISDFVLVGDLIEYELLPRLEVLHGGLGAHFVLDPSKPLP